MLNVGLTFMLCRSNKHDAARIISERVTRMMKIAAMSERLRKVEAEDEEDPDDAAAAADDEEQAGADNEDEESPFADTTTEVRSIYGQFMSMDQFCSNVLPNGAQFKGTSRHVCCCLQMCCCCGCVLLLLLLWSLYCDESIVNCVY